MVGGTVLQTITHAEKMKTSTDAIAPQILKAPFPWFGGKSKVTDIVWSRFGNVKNYVEPFFGSGAILLGRPYEHFEDSLHVETCNDKDCFISNFYRAISADPEQVACYADYPVNEADLHARHLWLVNQTDFIERMKSDPDFYDAKIAGWWVWGICQWIGSGWCARPEWQGRGHAGRKKVGIQADRVTKYRPWQTRPNMQRNGIHSVALAQKRPLLSRGVGVHRKRPALMNAAPGVHRVSLEENPPSRKLPILGNYGVGVHASKLATSGVGVHSPARQKPDTDARAQGKGVHAARHNSNLYDYFEALSARLRRVRVCCGDWTRVLGPAVTTCIGTTGVFLDPPYSHDERDNSIYSVDDNVGAAVREWALANGDNPQLVIALCGYEGEHDMPESWECIAWKANGGYGANGTGRGKDNSTRERIWFSPACLKPEGNYRTGLFS